MPFSNQKMFIPVAVATVAQALGYYLATRLAIRRAAAKEEASKPESKATVAVSRSKSDHILGDEPIRDVLLGCTGSVAAVKLPHLALALHAEGFKVSVVLTEAGKC